jgi:hypothetical protein
MIIPALISRRVLAAVTAAAALTTPRIALPSAGAGSDASSLSSSSSSSSSTFAVLPLRPTKGAFVAEYYVDGQRFRAVVDTGSPFLLVDGSCGGSNGGWGCYTYGSFGATTPASGSLDDVSEEGYGGQDVGVEWRRGIVRFPSLSAAPGAPSASAWQQPASSVSLSPSAAAGSTQLGDLSFEPVTFGVVRSYKGKGGSGAIYLGLVKDRQPRIRPSLLEQTDVQSLRFDFKGTPPFSSFSTSSPLPPTGPSKEMIDGYGRSLTLSRRPLIPPPPPLPSPSSSRGIGIVVPPVVPLVDLRPLGAPLASCE